MSLNNFVSTPKFEDYKERFKNFYNMERRADGVILVQAHTKGGPIQLSVENHRSVGQMFKTVGADPENEVMIFTGSGDEFMMDADPEGFKLEEQDLDYWAYEYAYKDGRINVSSLVNDLEIPTIGAAVHFVEVLEAFLVFVEFRRRNEVIQRHDRFLPRFWRGRA